jgi:hypothetical protein
VVTPQKQILVNVSCSKVGEKKKKRKKKKRRGIQKRKGII